MKKKKRKLKVALTMEEKVFNVVNIAILCLIVILTLYPLIYVVSSSFSKPFYIMTNQVWLLPKGFTVASYEELFKRPSLWTSYGNTLLYTFAGTAFSMLLTVIASYFLSRKPKGFPFFLGFIVINMWFKAGLIPSFLNYTALGLYNNRWALIIGGGLDVYNCIILKSFFDSIPKELEESAIIDGANPYQVLRHIHLPLSKTAIATITVFYVVAKWNEYVWPMILLTDVKKVPLQVLLKKWIVDADLSAELATTIITEATLVSVDSLVYTTIVVAMVPMMLLFPFVQKYFKKGVMIGSIKG